MLNWIAKNKEWLFSGIGVAVVAVVWSLVKMVHSWLLERQQFCVPITLSTFTIRHVPGAVEYTSKVRRITTIRALTNGTIRIAYPVFSLGRFKSAISVSHPNIMKVATAGDSEAENQLEIIAQKNRYYLVVSESVRTRRAKDKPKKPSPHDKVLHALFEKRLSSEKHVFVGTRIFARTEWLRLIVEFADGEKPANLNPIHIDPDGDIIRDEKNRDFTVAHCPDKSLYILDLESPDVGSGVYIWWKWEQ